MKMKEVYRDIDSLLWGKMKYQARLLPYTSMCLDPPEYEVFQASNEMDNRVMFSVKRRVRDELLFSVWRLARDGIL